MSYLSFAVYTLCEDDLQVIDTSVSRLNTTMEVTKPINVAAMIKGVLVGECVMFRIAYRTFKGIRNYDRKER